MSAPQFVRHSDQTFVWALKQTRSGVTGKTVPFKHMSQVIYCDELWIQQGIVRYRQAFFVKTTKCLVDGGYQFIQSSPKGMKKWTIIRTVDHVQQNVVSQHSKVEHYTGLMAYL